jgi:hypothetical protein
MVLALIVRSIIHIQQLKIILLVRFEVRTACVFSADAHVIAQYVRKLNVKCNVQSGTSWIETVLNLQCGRSVCMHAVLPLTHYQ